MFKKILHLLNEHSCLRLIYICVVSEVNLLVCLVTKVQL